MNRIVKSGKVRITVFMLLLFAIIMCFVLIFSGRSMAKNEFNSDNYAINRYESILIQRGDSLWTIAQKALPDADDSFISDYVDEIAKLNKIYPENVKTGKYIIVPIYDKKTTDTSI